MLGIAIVAENVPVLDDVTVAGVVVIMLLSNCIVIVLLASKLEPHTVTVVPVIPLAGNRVIDAGRAVTVNGLATGVEPSSTVIL